MIANLKGVPPYNKSLIVTRKNAITGDIIKTLTDCFSQAVEQTKEFAENFRGENNFKSAYNIWSFIRSNITYKKDGDGYQVVQSPGALLSRLNGDCKSQSLLISAVLYNLGANNVRLRFVSYKNNKIPTHVYCVFDFDGKTVPVDSVIKKFNFELPYKFKIDKNMNVYSLSGIDGTQREKMLKNAFEKTKRGTLCHNLIYKELRKERNQPQQTIVLTTDQYSFYKKRLEAHLNYHKKNNKLGLCYNLITAEYSALLNNNILDGIGSIGKIRLGKGLKKVFGGVKKVSLSPSRNAFLLLVKNNVFGLAGRLTFADPTKRAKFWASFGGNNNKLNTAISQGKVKRALLSNKEFGKISGIGAEPATTTAAAIAAAAPILAVVAKLLGNMKKAPKLDKDGKPVLDKNGNPEYTTGSGILDLIKNVAGSEVIQSGLQAAGAVVDVNEDSGTVTTKPDVEIEDKDKGFKLSTPILIGGAGLLAILLLRKK
jgi:hypothetical protein